MLKSSSYSINDLIQSEIRISVICADTNNAKYRAFMVIGLTTCGSGKCRGEWIKVVVRSDMWILRECDNIHILDK